MAKVLIVDDDADFRETCRIPLEAAGLQVAEADNADAGLAKVRAEKPDVVILDVLMPQEYDGFDLARRIREELDLRELPIVMLSVVHQTKRVPYRFSPDETHLPVDAFLDKPVPPEVLVRKVRELLGLHREEPQSPL